LISLLLWLRPEHGYIILIFDNFYTCNLITLTDAVDYIQVFYHLTKAGMVSIQMCRIIPTVADKKLRTSGITTSMSHGKNPTVMVLIFSIKLTFDGITRSASTCTGRVTALNHEIRDHTVKGHPIIES